MIYQTFYAKAIGSSANKQKSLFEVVDKLLDKKDARVLPTHTDATALANDFNKYYSWLGHALQHPSKFGFQFFLATVANITQLTTGSCVAMTGLMLAQFEDIESQIKITSSEGSWFGKF